MQPFKCLRSEPNLLVQFSTGRTWQSAEVGEPMLSSSAVDGKKWIASQGLSAAHRKRSFRKAPALASIPDTKKAKNQNRKYSKRLSF